MSNKKTYSQKEVSEILSKTVELQKQFSKREETGLTEEELYQIAEEAGLDKTALKETLLNFSSPSNNSKFNFLRGSSRLNHIQMLPGEINDELWDEIHVELRSSIGESGVPKKSGNTYKLEQPAQELGYKHLSLIPKEGNTRFEYIEEWSAFKLLTLIISFVIASGITLITLKEIGLSKLFHVLLAPFGGFLGAGLSMLGLRIYFNSKKEKLSQIIDLISKKLNPKKNQRIFIEEDAYNTDEEKNSDSNSRLKE